MSTVYVCPERDIECGRYPANWCELCPQRPPPVVVNTEQEAINLFGKPEGSVNPQDSDEEPAWAHKNIAAPSDLKIGDYVFASRWKDCDPGDPWRVGRVDALGPNWVSLDANGRRYPNAMRITVEQGERIIAQYPALEHARGPIPYATILKIFNPPTGCSQCGIVGLHACPGAAITAMTLESKRKLVAILAEYPPVSITVNDSGGKVPTIDARNVLSREGAFIEIRRVLADPNQDGVLAKIRRIIAETP